MFKKLLLFLIPIFLAMFISIAGATCYEFDIILPWQKMCIDNTKYPSIENLQLEFTTNTINVSAYDILDVDLSTTNRSFVNWVKGETIPINSKWKVNEEKLSQLLDTLYVANVNASIIIDNEKLRLIPHELNMDFDKDEVIELVKECVKAGKRVIDVREACNNPVVSTNDLEPVYQNNSWINSFHIEYTDGTVISSKDLLKAWNAETNSLDVSILDFSEVINTLVSNYDTTGNSLSFKNSYGDEIVVPYKTYGISVNEDSELEYINNAILNMESVNERQPVVNGYDSFTGTYIEIDISGQHVWHYVDGKLHCESNCVTGTKGVHDTPTGVFYITEKIGGKYLRGADYKTWVNQWMRLTNSGIGLHDAYWRNSFGNTIYKYNGSHGCINLPPSYAKALYNEVSRGLPVVIYE